VAFVPGKSAAQVLEATDIAVAFGGLIAINAVSLTLQIEEILGLIGPNGAGKTTLVNVLTGFQHPTRGRVSLCGFDMTGRPAHEFARAGIVRTFQAVRLFHDLLVIENLEAAAVGSGVSRRASRIRATKILEWIEFGHKAYHRADSLPYGEERRVGIARALATAPKFLLLDEPAAGLSDAECDDLMRLVARIPETFGCGVLLIDHNMRVVMGACQRIHVIDVGRTIAEGTPGEVQRHPAVVRAYLGSKSEHPHARRT
jgi:branched-chain amino acid transport system ATP-binding protein